MLDRIAFKQSITCFNADIADCVIQYQECYLLPRKCGEKKDFFITKSPKNFTL